MISCDFNCQCGSPFCFGQPKTIDEKINRKAAAKIISGSLNKTQMEKDKLYDDLNKKGQAWSGDWLMKMKPIITNNTF